MNLKGDGQLKPLAEIATKNNLTISFLQKQISLGRLMFKKKGKIFYSAQSWIEQYKKDFTFDGFMMDRIFSDKEKNVLAPRKQKNKSFGKIVKEEKADLDIEEALVGKWNNEFRKINDDFKNLTKTKNSKVKNDLSSNPHNIHSAVLAVAIMFLLSFYVATLMPSTAESFTKKIDSLINTPYSYINKLALTKIIDEDRASLETGVPSSAQLSKYIKDKASKITYPAGTSIDVRGDEINGRVAGIDEGIDVDDPKVIDRIKETTLKIFTTISDKQKRASLKLNEKLNNLISKIKE
ncbi:MAG: hypothetical protein PF572_05390 [Patescibacteria group bacterium]|jgi:hypothetical protein|nr:hypothetical protein [Patescibacteria group bacterium]